VTRQLVPRRSSELPQGQRLAGTRLN
jgi:hypothetical protein